MCPPALYCCVRLCLAILYICLPALDVASSSFDFEKHKLFGVYGGVIICLPLLFICLPGSFVSQAGCLWSGSRLACLPFLLFSFVSQFFSFVSQAGCLWSGCFPAGLSLTSFHTPIAMLWGLAKLIGGRAPSGHRQSWWADGVPVMF